MSAPQRTTTAIPMQTVSTHRDPTGVHARRASMETDFPAPVRLLTFQINPNWIPVQCAVSFMTHWSVLFQTWMSAQTT